MRNPRYANEINGILLDYDEEGMPSLYVDSGELYSRAIAGEFGPIAAYVPPPAPTFEERLASARASATLTRREFFQQLIVWNLYDTVMAMADDPTVPLEVRVDLKEATSFDRTWPTLVEMAHSLGFTDEQLDALFGIEVTP